MQTSSWLIPMQQLRHYLTADVTASQGDGHMGPDDPQLDIRAGIIIAALFFVVFIGWAAVARMDAAAYASGRVTVSGQRQVVQHRDGGVVGAILVKEGQVVRQGEVLLRLAAAEVQADAAALAGQSYSLLAQRARLRAEQLGQRQITPPEEFLSLTGKDRAEADLAMKIQEVQLRTRSSLLVTQRGVYGQQRAQAGDQRHGYAAQLASVREQERLIVQELESLRPVAEKGFVSMSRVRALERARADLVGQGGKLEAAMAESAGSMGESSLRSTETLNARQESVAAELREVELALSDVLPKLNAAKDRLARTEVRASATGTVVGLSVFTVGGVIAPGQKLMDIVPNKAPMVIEARFSPDDIDDVLIGQTATVRLTGLQDRNLPILEGQITLNFSR
ncbi:HlyD family type I secretion periplasmic adaptor subunit [Aquisediminimonas sediminicola]|uniref:HlyD family type I secretion periplasmic adaptor subunit n=1 Tax=Alteraquisediminimonas sediminicola TaxID=2676787 RepID=UPI001FE89B87|nr:HlyD family type I secretion periplasmic adaptor subunit [Aquisediminimonas sediminicola]